MIFSKIILHGLQATGWFVFLIVVAVVAFALIVMLLRYEQKLVPRKVGFTLLAMRLALIVALVFTLLQPVFNWTETGLLEGHIVVAVDLSGSMAEPDKHAQKAEKLRWARAIGMIGNQKTNARINRWIKAYENNREPEWVDADETNNPAKKRELARSREKNVQEIFKEVDRLSRKEIAMRVLLKGPNPLLPQLQKIAAVDVVVFGGKVLNSEAKTLENTIKNPPRSLDSDASDLAKALSRSARSRGGSQVIGVVLLTDGRDNSDSDVRKVVAAARKLGRGKSKRTPVFPVILGSVLKPKDLSFGKLDYNKKPIVETVDDDENNGDSKQKLTQKLVAHLNTSGFKGKTLTVTLEREGEKPETKTVVPKGETATVEFELDKSKIGRFEYTIRVKPPAGESETHDDNNAKSFAMTVVKDKVSVLLVEGEAGWEFRFIDNALKRDKKVELTQVVFRQPYMGLLNEGFFPRDLKLPADADDLKQSPFSHLDLVILGDVDSSELTEKGWKLLERFVGQSGGTLVMVAGKEFFPRTHQSPILQAMLPVTNLKPLLSSGGGSPSERGFHLHLTPEGEREPMFQFADDEEKNRQIWANLPGHTWGLLGEAKKGATVLAHTDRPGEKKTLENQRKSAVIVKQKYGAGQVLWIGINSTWRWRHRIGDLYHHRFWGRICLWALSNAAAVVTESVEFGPLQEDVEMGKEAVIQAKWNPEFLQKHPRLKPLVEIYKTDDMERFNPIAVVEMTTSESNPLVSEARILSLPRGSYRIRLVAEEEKPDGKGGVSKTPVQLADEPLETELNFFLKQSKELNDVTANPALLQEVASQTQGKRGKLFLPDEVHEIPARLRNTSDSREDNPETRIWDHWLMMVLFFTLLTTEWVVRKLNGLP